MNNKTIIAAVCMQLIGCANLKYPNWEYVRIENQIPSAGCIYKMQEACSLRTNACMNWHKQRATTFDANTVVITSAETQKDSSVGVWSARVGENSSTIAEYYYCTGSKNIKPS